MEASIIRLKSSNLKQLNNRSIIKNIVSIDKSSKTVTIDFEGIEFISRAAAHELLTIISDLSVNNIHVTMINKNLDVQQMLDIVSKSIQTNSRALPNLNNITFNSFDAFNDYMMAI